MARGANGFDDTVLPADLVILEQEPPFGRPADNEGGIQLSRYAPAGAEHRHQSRHGGYSNGCRAPVGVGRSGFVKPGGARRRGRAG
ncbi:hypothetical protein DB31_1270 [Hyalangium minutum]|uniref:Uncharacterized protein n=1 Tax=Hyalangium minutum TaxID=394096 RepID=A0A085WEU2_9BACT|nr:hypothetical protein DB31_1270 [Hyalangium minutum]